MFCNIVFFRDVGMTEEGNLYCVGGDIAMVFPRHKIFPLFGEPKWIMFEVSNDNEGVNYDDIA